MDLEERITKAEAYFREVVPLEKAICGVSEGGITRRDNAIVVTMGGKIVLSLMHQDLLAHASNEAFRSMLDRRWRRALAMWESQRLRGRRRMRLG
jgi:hypothetical protein